MSSDSVASTCRHCQRAVRSVIVHGLLFGVVATATAQEAPVIINQETGAQVDLIRPYWNGNVDIANRRIQCDYFAFNEETAVFEERSIGPFRRSTEFFHNPLHEGGGASVVSDSLGLYPRASWFVIDGQYRGNTPLGGFFNPFIELVTYNASSNGNQNNAVRQWDSDDTGASYFVCYDLDGALLRPTGSAEIGNTDLLPEQNFTFQLPSSGTPVTEAPEIIRLDTGEPVEFVRAEFDYNGDLKGKRMNCGAYSWNGERYRQLQRGAGATRYHTFNHSYVGGDSVLIKSGADDDEELSTITSLDVFLDFTLPSRSHMGHIEVVTSGYNVWYDDHAGGFEACRLEREGPELFAPNRILSTAQGSCDYSNADEFDGWGWNSVTQQSCAPLEAIPTNNCDYSDASSFNGWGWDPVAQTSCAPIESAVVTTVPTSNNNEAEQCDYSNAGLHLGWGWNSTLGESCPPQATELTTPSNNCVDDDNDGWGWNGVGSCQVAPVTSSVALNDCIDTDGDGWGWDGTSSCRVE